MLQSIRDRAQGVFAWIIVGMISIPFALWGINSYFGGGGDDSVAEVDGIKISSREVQSAYQQQRERLKQMFGGKIPDNLFSEEVMKSQVLQQLIEKEILIKAGYESGLRIGDRQLGQMIREIDAFYADGKFDPETYERVLARQGMSPKLFEQRVRRDLISGQLSEAITATEFTLDNEVDGQLAMQLQQRDIGYMLVPVSQFEAGTEVTEEETQGYYETNSRRYMQPEQVKIDYLELNAADLASSIEVDETELRQRYEAQKMNFRTAEERKASHILIQSGNDKAAAKAKAEALLSRLQAGEDFAELAKAESQDPGSAKQGGDLGFFGLGVMDKAFEGATFALEKGQMSGVVESAFGFHIIKLTDTRGGETKAYEQVAAELKSEVQNERAAEQFYDLAEQLANYTYEQPDTLSVAAEQLQLEVKSSDYFPRSGGVGITAEAKVIEAAFSEDVLARGNNSETIELEDNHLLVVRINDHKPEALRPLDEVKGEIEGAIKREKATAKTLEVATELFDKVKAGGEVAALAATQGLSWEKQDGLKRDNSELDRSMVQAVFRMPHPAEGVNSQELVTLPNGDQAVVVLYAVNAGDAASAEATERSDAEQRLARANANAAEQGLIDGLRSRAEISVKQ